MTNFASARPWPAARRVSLLVVMMWVAVLGLSPTAAAHTSFYPNTWNTGLSINWYFDDTFPTGSYRSRVLDGTAQWNAQGGTAEPNFSNAGTLNVGDSQIPCNAPGRGGVDWRSLDFLGAGVLGVTRLCYDRFDKVIKFTVAFDTSGGTFGWYNGTGDAPAGDNDFWSNATHELGHATAWLGHFAETAPECPNDSTRHTMCPSIVVGTERQRTVTTHDIHSFTGAY